MRRALIKITRGVVQMRRISSSMALPLGGYCHFPQSLDALLKRWVSAEQRGQAATAEQRLHDAQGRGRRGKRLRGYPLIVSPQLLERAHQTVWLAHHPRPRFVCGELSLARKAELQQECPKGSEEK